MKCSVLVCLLVVVFLPKDISSEYFSSTDELKSLVDIEDVLLKGLGEYIFASRKILNDIERIYLALLDEHDIVFENIDNYVTNPISAFNLVRRLSVEWPHLVDLLENKSSKERFAEVYDKFADVWPDLKELKGAARGIIRIQEIYGYTTNDLVKGVLGNKYYGKKFSSEDCLEIGKELFAQKKYTKSIEWLTEANRLSFGYLQKYEAIYQLALSYKHVGKSQKALELISNELDDDHGNKISLMKYYEQSILDNLTFKEAQEDEEMITCRDDTVLSPKNSRDLYCQYVHFEQIPFLKIAPFKMELLHADPKIVRFYDVISDDEINYAMSEAAPNLERSLVGGTESTVSDIRISQQIGLNMTHHPVMENFHQRLCDLTITKANTSENLQIANYGIGGFYYKHHDYFGSEVDQATTGDRLLTALYYISDVEIGGGTAFPKLKLLVKPIKKSMVLWHNLHPSGNPDKRTLHVGCPVVKGSKWILTSWIQERGQEFLHPCPKDYDTKLEI